MSRSVPVRPPAGAPNVLVVLVDDMGFGASSAYGGPCRHADRRAAGRGRAALQPLPRHRAVLADPAGADDRPQPPLRRHGRHLGDVHAGSPATPATGRRSAATLAQILGGNGYSTAAFGKWHQTPPVEVDGRPGRSPLADRGGLRRASTASWAREMNHWYPQLYDGTTPVEPRPAARGGLPPDRGPRRPRRRLGAHPAVAAPRTSRSSPTSPSARRTRRSTSRREWRRALRAALRRRLGRAARDARSRGRRSSASCRRTPSWRRGPHGVPHWDELDADAQAGGRAVLMETYAGFAEHADHHVGRLVDALDEPRRARGHAGPLPARRQRRVGGGRTRGHRSREHLVGHGFADDTAAMDAARSTSFGGPTTYAASTRSGWALAMNTPYQWTKQVASHYGGTRDGLVVHWPARHRAPAARCGTSGTTSSTCCRRSSRRPACRTPTLVNGVAAAADRGHVSMRYSLRRRRRAGRRHARSTSRWSATAAIYHEGWTAVTRHGTPWLMVDGGDRPLRGRRVGALRHPHRLDPGPRPRRRAARAAARAAGAVRRSRPARHQVFPLDDRVTERENPAVAGRLDLHHGRTSIELGPRAGRLTEEAAPNVKNRSHTDHRPARRGRRRTTACWSRRAAASAAGRCTASTAVRRTPTTATAAT